VHSCLNDGPHIGALHLARKLHCIACMSNWTLYGAMGATGNPVTSTLATIDGSLAMALGLAVLLAGGVLLSAAMRDQRVSRRLTLRSVVHWRRAAI
jgi:hypothetical protein